MSEVVVRIPLQSSLDEDRFSATVDAFARWRGDDSLRARDPELAPMLMVRTEWGPRNLLKTVVFEQRGEAAMFLRLWRSGRAQTARNILRDALMDRPVTALGTPETA